ncbi:GNAT family N-acetyltransferase [Cryptosporangium phraense]|nr:GNAT family N-acetyltransferase [Cryptosporangium phraense]
MNVKVRAFRTEDLSAVHPVETGLFGREALPRFAFAQLLDMVHDGFQVAEVDGKVVGYVVAVRKDYRAEPTVLTSAMLPIPGHEHLLPRLTAAATVAAANAYPVGVSGTPDQPAETLGYCVRRFRVDDVESLFEVELSAFGGEPYPRRLFRSLAVLGDGYFVAERLDERRAPEVVGYLAAFRDTNDQKLGWVMSMAVHREHQDRGVGTRLLAAAEKYFADNGCREVMLTVDPQNAVALHLYEKRHYTAIEMHIDHHGLKLSRLLMRQHSYVDQYVAPTRPLDIRPDNRSGSTRQDKGQLPERRTGLQTWWR